MPVVKKPGKLLKLPTPKKGDLVEVLWVDIAGSDSGGAKDAECPKFTTPGYYVGYQNLKGTRALVCERSQDDGTFSRGWDAYPAQNVLAVKVIRRTDG